MVNQIGTFINLQFDINTMVYTFTVGASTDDVHAERSDGSFELTWTDMYAGDFNDATYDYEFGMRWTVDIPQGSTIASAYLKLVCKAVTGAIPVIIISGEDANDPITFDDWADYNARSRTSETVEWTPSGQTAGVTYTSGDIKTIIQAIVNRGGFGTHIVLFCTHALGWGGVQNSWGAAQWDHATYDPPKLEVTWIVRAKENIVSKVMQGMDLI